MTTQHLLPGSTEALREHVAATLDRGRERTTALTSVEPEELTAQHSALMSPLVWDFAHIGNQEELWLVRDVGGRDPVRCDIDELYDAFLNSRASRVSLPLLAPAEAREYVRTVRQKVLDVLESSPLNGRRLERDAFAFGMVAQHEQQHAETMLATHQLRVGAPVLHAPPPPAAVATLPAEVVVAAGEFVMGTSTEPWALDNERPAHTVHVEGFAIDTTPVSNGAWLEFLRAGGYQRPELWTRTGWAHRVDAGLTAPLFWENDGSDAWYRRCFGELIALEERQPVVHVSFHEAQAYARWVGRRLPTEAEWEYAARAGTKTRYAWGDAMLPGRASCRGCGDPVDSQSPPWVGVYPPNQFGLYAMGGGVAEWVADCWHRDYQGAPRDGSAAWDAPGCHERVLRGGAWGSEAGDLRVSSREFYDASVRYPTHGFRVAKSE